MMTHLLILCCYGGSPFVDLHLSSGSDAKHRSTYLLDPTDWIAIDTSGAQLNSTIQPGDPTNSPVFEIPSGVAIQDCDLFNLTFTNVADERLFENYKGSVQCRCPPDRSGNACQYSTNDPVTNVEPPSASIPVVTLLGLITVLAAAAVFMAMRCGFCDCFGPFRSPFTKDDLDAPLDENTVNRCLELVRAHEARQNSKLGDYNSPLIPTVSEGCSPYNTTVEPCPSNDPYFRSTSPPPSYRSRNGSVNQLYSLSIGGDNTKL